MQNESSIQRVITWNTKKVATGFEAVIYSFDYKVDNVIHARHVFKTRARAAGYAKKATRYLNSLQK